jgi:purine-binding chemotaxis protein CheW
METSTSELRKADASGRTIELATFYVNDVLLGIDIQHMEEITRQTDVTSVPLAPGCVRGVLNLRGDVVTVVDLRTVMGLPRTKITLRSRNIVVRSEGERIALLVDRVADVVQAVVDEIEPPPANVRGIDGRYFTGVCKLEGELLVMLDVEEVLSAEAAEEVAA